MAKKKSASTSEGERDNWIADMEARKAAELKAQLDLVKIERAHHGRAPRKIGTITAKTGITNGYHDERATYVLRLDDEGRFIAVDGDTWYISKSRDALQAKMDQVARITLDLKWTRYIEIDYEAERESDSSWHSDRTLSLGDKRKKSDRILGLTLKWKVVEFSDAFKLPGDDGVKFLRRKVIDGEPESTQETEREMPAGLVPYTPAREALLLSVVEAFTAIDAKLVDMLRGEPDEVAAKLDERAGAPLLLTGGKP